MTHAIQPTHHDTDIDTDDLPNAERDVFAELAALAEDPPEWQERALCAQTDPEAFFPEQGGSTREAKQICQGCEVRAECLEAALADDERFGIWGGLSQQERRRLKPHQVPRAVPPEVEVPEQTRRESAPAPGPGRHAGGTGPVTTLPTEPRHPRGRPAQPRPSTFPDRARATAHPDAEPTPVPTSRSAVRGSSTRGRRSRPDTRRTKKATAKNAELGAATVTALRPDSPDPGTTTAEADGTVDRNAANDQAAAAAGVPPRPPDPARSATDRVLEGVLASHAGQPGAESVEAAVVAALAAGNPVAEASEWEIALAAVTAVQAGRTRGAVARLLGEDTRDVAHWVRRQCEGMPMVDPHGDGTPDGTVREARPVLGGAR